MEFSLLQFWVLMDQLVYDLPFNMEQSVYQDTLPSSSIDRWDRLQKYIKK